MNKGQNSGKYFHGCVKNHSFDCLLHIILNDSTELYIAMMAHNGLDIFVPMILEHIEVPTLLQLGSKTI